MEYICYDGTNIIDVTHISDIIEEWNDIVIVPNTIFNPDGTVSKSGRDLRKEKLVEFIALFTRVWPI